MYSFTGRSGIKKVGTVKSWKACAQLHDGHTAHKKGKSKPRNKIFYHWHTQKKKTELMLKRKNMRYKLVNLRRLDGKNKKK